MNFFSLFKRNLIYKFKKKISIDKDTNEKKSLDDLFYFYGSDKANIFRLSNEKGHGYSLFYEEQLQHFKGIGVRIEDDVLITKNGNRVLTDGIPKTVNEIEAIRG